MSIFHTQYATALVEELLQAGEGFRAHPVASHKLVVRDEAKEIVLDLTPFEASPRPADAAPLFRNVSTMEELIEAYWRARRSLPFESDLKELQKHVDAYADEFLTALLNRAASIFSDADARLIAGWVSDFDVYVAVKSVESLIGSQADLTLLKLAGQLGWRLHFDHLAIRCGSALDGATQRVAALLCDQHGYTAPQLAEERFYHFADRWSASPLYKILENGQVLRLFLDESDGSNPKQIIQHWHRVYGFTAHHLAIRATRLDHGRRVAVPLNEMMSRLTAHGVGVMTPTGEYTGGLLLQVFARPERNPHVPETIKRELADVAPELATTIENGKLLELLSRREVSPELAVQYYELYGLHFDPDNPLHSVPAYQYFLPAQAAHVIRTSVQAQGA